MKTITKQQPIILFSMVSNNASSTDNDVAMPQNIITEEEALSMRACFYQNQYEFINTGLQGRFPQATADKSHITFDLEDLKKFIALAEASASEQQYENIGIRMYKAAKLDDNGMPISTVYMRAVGSSSKSKLTGTIAFNELDPIPGSAYYNKGHVGGNGSGTGNQQ